MVKLTETGKIFCLFKRLSFCHLEISKNRSSNKLSEIGIPNMNAMRKKINRLLSQGISGFSLVVIHPESLGKLNSLFGIKAIENIFIQTNNLLLETFKEAHLIALSSWGDFVILLDVSDYNRVKLESFNTYSITLAININKSVRGIGRLYINPNRMVTLNHKIFVFRF